MTRSAKFVYGAVAGCAVTAYLGALWNGYALDDVNLIALNPLLRGWSGVWRAFGESYWPTALGGFMYRPLTVASFVVDARVDGVRWLHAVNVLWHVGASVAVAWLADRWTTSTRAALLAGVVFAVHPVHVEAVANLVGRTELMAAVLVVLSTYLALEHDRLWLSLLALAAALLSKENAAIAPLLIAWGWLLGIGGRPGARRRWAYVAGWTAVGVAYTVARWGALHGSAGQVNLAPVFLGASPADVRLTAVAALSDVLRLLAFPLVLRADYSPAERTLVSSALDARFLAGALCALALAGLVVVAWRRGRKLEAFGLGWVAIALLPVANLLFPTGVLVAERTLYLPSVGLAVALGAWARDLSMRPCAALATGIALLGGARTALRVPVWRDSRTVTLSMLDDSPSSYAGPAGMIGIYLSQGQPGKALEAFQVATSLYDRVPTVYLEGAYAAFKLGRSRLADSLLGRLEQLCERCDYYYQFEAATARAWGDTAVAESLLARMRGPAAP